MARIGHTNKEKYVNRNCAVCNAAFHVLASGITPSHPRNTCSRDCMLKNRGQAWKDAIRDGVKKSIKHPSKMQTGSKNPNWDGGKGHIHHTGYRIVCRNGKQIAEHRWVMQEFLGRELFDHENVHHKNGDRTDNRIENLELWNTQQPMGQKVEDKIKYATEILSKYQIQFNNFTLNDAVAGMLMG